MSLLVEMQNKKECTFIQLKGILDITTIEDFVTQIEVLPEVHSLILDFSNLEFIDSTGIGAIMELIYLAKENNFSIELQGMDEGIKQIFEVVGLFMIMKVLKREGA
ncbi:STAS domain-containing protein [Neobacillus rhizosphaerae]|uniref:STAS domain-containing protein n=1 Tax=Neobacillus rhizosphaerae TaxID=2880965 RepID=UPI003D2A054C